MRDAPPAMKWWGWGDPHRQESLQGPALDALRSELGAPPRETSAVSLDAVRIREPALRKGARRRLEEAVGKDALREDRLTRVTHAAGKSYPDLVRMRAGDAARLDESQSRIQRFGKCP